ncbi:MAG: ion transporter [Vicingaceae bacterium]
MSQTRKYIRHIIFDADTPASKRFDVVLLWAILLSVLVVMLDSVQHIVDNYGGLLRLFEWIFTVVFTVEYILRIWTTEKPLKYITSFYGLVDLVSVLPTYISLVLVGSQYLVVIRTLRLLRVFRILKLVSFLKEAGLLLGALKESRYKLTVFMGTVLALDIIIGTLMYMIEGPEHGFNSIPHSIYWAIVTMTTVGYGDIAPQTVLGQTLASIVMLLGYTIIAVPTGIVSATLVGQGEEQGLIAKTCPKCSQEGHAEDAKFCKHCGSAMIS